MSMVDVAQLVESRIVIPAVAGSNPVVHPIFKCGPLAQLVEQETLNLLVEGSTPSRPTSFLIDPRPTLSDIRQKMTPLERPESATDFRSA
jgi:hypothetical protein